MAKNDGHSPRHKRRRTTDYDRSQDILTSFDPGAASPAKNDDTEPECNSKHPQQIVHTSLQQMDQRQAIMSNLPTSMNKMRAEYFIIDPDKEGGPPTYVRLLRPVQTHAPKELNVLEGISWMTHDENKPRIMSQLHRHLYTKEGRRGDYGQIIYPEKADVGKPISKFALWQSPIRKVPIRAQNSPHQNYFQPDANNVTEILIGMIPNPSSYKSNPLSVPPPVLNCGALHLRGLSALDSHSEPSASSNLVMNTFEVLKAALSWRDRVPPPPLAKGPACSNQKEDARVRFEEGYQFVGREMFFGPGLVLREHDWCYGTWSVRSHPWDAMDDEGNAVKEIISIDDSDAGC